MVGRVTHAISRTGRQLDPGHWFGPTAVVALGCALAWIVVGFGHGAPLALLVLATATVLALRNSPLRVTGHEPMYAVRGMARTDRTVVVLWRPGCPYSSALRRRATREGLAIHWVNIWRDEDAHELCCSINGGSEETPTAMLLDPSSPGPIVIPASVAGIREATAAPAPRTHSR